MTPDDLATMLDADAADEARYHLLALQFDERDDDVILLSQPDAEGPSPSAS